MNRTSWIIISITAVICLVLGFFFSRPYISDGWKIYKEIQTAKSELDKVSNKKNALADLYKKNQVGSLYDIAAKYIPESDNSSELVIGLSAMATESKLNVDQLSFDQKAATPAPAAAATETATEGAAEGTTTPTNTASSGGVKEITFSMTVSGTFPDFLNFLKRTETSARLITFTDMSFSQSDVSFIAQLSGTSYWKKGNNLENTLDNIKISQETIDKFQNLKSYGTPINLPTESGFGRTNPFEGI